MKKKEGYIMQQRLTAFIEKENNGYYSLCPELDIASQGKTVEEARTNLTEAVQLFFETASSSEIQQRIHKEFFLTTFEVAVA
jgi:predicted RNase H-like HicB family nuclease